MACGARAGGVRGARWWRAGRHFPNAGHQPGLTFSMELISGAVGNKACGAMRTVQSMRSVQYIDAPSQPRRIIRIIFLIIRIILYIYAIHRCAKPAPEGDQAECPHREGAGPLPLARGGETMCVAATYCWTSSSMSEDSERAAGRRLRSLVGGREF